MNLLSSPLARAGALLLPLALANMLASAGFYLFLAVYHLVHGALVTILSQFGAIHVTRKAKAQFQKIIG